MSINLNTLTENASRLGMRLQETFSEHTRDLAIARGSGSMYLDGADDKIKNIRRQLDSSSDRDKLDAMKRLVALISKGRNVSEYFAQVVKNVASQNLEIRKLVYIYLLRYAEQEPDLALLSINTFQKDLNDHSPLIRAMALRVLSGIKVPMIGSIVVLAIKKCAADLSPYVRKGAALAIPKCYELDSSHLPSLIGIIASLLAERSPLAIGSVAVAFEAVCPTRLDLLHRQYRRLCKILVDADEWGQIDLLGLLARYARTMLSRPPADVESLDSEELDPDIRLLLTSSEPLLQSCNPAVVLAVSRVFLYIGPPSELPKIVHPLLRLLQVSKEVERVTLAYLLVICRNHSHLFSPHYTRFLVLSDDLRQTKQDKIRILLKVMTLDNHQAILREFIDYADDTDDDVVADSIHAIGRCSRLAPDCVQQCLTALMTMIKSRHDVVVSNAVLVLKALVQSQLQPSPSAVNRPTESPLTIISYLARRIEDIRHPQAKACVIWLVGQYSPDPESKSAMEGIADWAPDVLRRSAKTFIHEKPMVKLQIVALAAKLLVLSPADKRLALLAGYVFSLARYDLNYDVRDRARMLTSLLAGIASNILGDDPHEDQNSVVLRREQIRLVLFEGKAGTVETEVAADERAMIGSLGLITGKDMHGDNLLPDWLEQGIDTSLRENPQDVPPTPAAAPATISASHYRSSAAATPVVLTPIESGSPATGPAWTDLDKFYEDKEEEEEEEEEEEDEEDDDDEEDEMSDDSEEGQDDHDGDPAPTGEENGSESSENTEEESEEEDEDPHEGQGILQDATLNPRHPEIAYETEWSGHVP
ncbi:hypothetical protein PLICRDRAFT_168063 [Plicaturopsis crispa FD-325 SS-3]|uniref:Clathrin/coatomer adaptor adaptin-like N-terminal domain-containing protein n=1 Tax=Plicaturopsis crispa FD-325 SS-3 TaxID=944288 RepID=A0A0C9SKW7_PLICR|nr:hypothetical protein PLICRDRAFT_168063 [Plicaturopsis crispa FD-325 SS-3]